MTSAILYGHDKKATNHDENNVQIMRRDDDDKNSKYYTLDCVGNIDCTILVSTIIFLLKLLTKRLLSVCFNFSLPFSRGLYCIMCPQYLYIQWLSLMYIL